MAKTEKVFHKLAPIYDETSRILMLGTMPSPKSREIGFYYGHPRNRFWPVMAKILGEPFPENKEEKREMLLRHHIALWDVLASCEIKGADDNSITDPIPNDLRRITGHAPITAIYATGTKAAALYRKYCEKEVGMPITVLPSTSPANCRVSDEELVSIYRKQLFQQLQH